MRHAIGIEQVATEFDEHRSDRTLAARNPAGESYAQHGPETVCNLGTKNSPPKLGGVAARSADGAICSKFARTALHKDIREAHLICGFASLLTRGINILDASPVL